MAVSSFVRLLQIFAGLGSVATTPLAVQLANKHINRIDGARGRSIGDNRIPEQEEIMPTVEEPKNLKQGDVMTEVKKILGDGKPKCAWLPNQTRGLEFLVCVYENKLETPFLFHYDSKNQLGKGRRVKQVEQIEFTTGPSTMKFKNESSLSVKGIAKLYLTTLFGKKSVTLAPESHCNISEDKGNYQLSCADSSNGQTKDVGKVDLESLHQSRHTTLTR